MKTHQFTATIAAALLGATAFHAPAVRANDCESAAKVASDIWQDWGQEISQGGCVGAAALTVILSAGAAAPEAAGVYEKCYSAVSKFDEISQAIIKNWNNHAGNTWSHIGPRALEPGKTLTGTVVSTFERMFITPAPIPASVDEVDIDLKKIGGNGKTSVDVCKVSADGKASNVWSFTIDSGDDNDSHTWSKTLKNVSGYVLTVHLDGKSVTKKLQYELKAKMHEVSAATHTASAK